MGVSPDCVVWSVVLVVVLAGDTSARRARFRAMDRQAAAACTLRLRCEITEHRHATTLPMRRWSLMPEFDELMRERDRPSRSAVSRVAYRQQPDPAGRGRTERHLCRAVTHLVPLMSLDNVFSGGELIIGWPGPRSWLAPTWGERLPVRVEDRRAGS